MVKCGISIILFYDRLMKFSVTFFNTSISGIAIAVLKLIISLIVPIKIIAEEILSSFTVGYRRQLTYFTTLVN